MSEQQNIEYKSSWHDDYLKWICGFANAQGGTIFIGKDDSGKVIGLPDFKALMDEIPNKIRNQLGIMSEVNLLESNGLKYIEIITPPYSVPISLRGRYYYRSGSVKQELVGPALNEFLLKKSGKTWDDVVEPRATLADVDESTIKAFLKAAGNAGRLPEFEGLDTASLLEKLRLFENNQLKRAAIVLFGKDPGKFFPNMFVKIGRFGISDADLKYQEQEEGNIIKLLENVINQLNHKFILSKDIFTEEYLSKLGLSQRQINAIFHMKKAGEISNSEYQSLNKISKATATRDLQELVDKKLITNKGSKGQGAVYVLVK